MRTGVPGAATVGVTATISVASAAPSAKLGADRDGQPERERDGGAEQTASAAVPGTARPAGGGPKQHRPSEEPHDVAPPPSSAPTVQPQATATPSAAPSATPSAAPSATPKATAVPPQEDGEFFNRQKPKSQ